MCQEKIVICANCLTQNERGKALDGLQIALVNEDVAKIINLGEVDTNTIFVECLQGCNDFDNCGIYTTKVSGNRNQDIGLNQSDINN